MQVQPVDSLFTASSPLSAPTYENPARELTEGRDKSLSSKSPNTVHLNAKLEAEYFTDQKIAIEYTSKDGDKVTFSMESLQYQKTMLDVDAEGGANDIQKIVDYIKKEYTSMREELQKAFIKSVGGHVDETGQADETGGSAALNIPEYWNAENTSQRIVDFAVSFLGAFKGSGEDFLKLIKDAIDKGFKEAVGFFGDLPDQVKSLVDDTHRLVMEKLDKWAQEKGVAVAGSEQTGTTEPEKAAA
jgi:hypothetical protein